MTILWDQLRGLVVLNEQEDRRPDLQASAWTPAVDVLDTPDGYVLMAELPGFSVDQVTITARDRHLTLSGRRPTPAVRAEQFHRIERGYGSFSRTFAFPLPTDVGRVTAQCADGVLTITIPKAKRPDPRRVKIR